MPSRALVKSGRYMQLEKFLVFAFLLMAGGLAIGYGFGSTVTKAPSSITTVTASSESTAPSNTTAPYDLTLVITTNNIYNSTYGDQPAYYVLGANGLQSSANISLPANRLIRLVIICYDNGSAMLTNPQDANVAGTQNNQVTEVSNDNVNSSQGASGIQVSGGQMVSSVAPNDIAHTFTIPELGINIPVAPSSTVTAYFTITKAGTFAWLCMTMCGFGPDGAIGAMSTPGWMEGNLVVS
jgi:Cytochrome C oxidase subunit II, periplasmic domain